ncbi:MAG: EamA family transporter [Candidatus Kariarchaeaceae archaeon]
MLDPYFSISLALFASFAWGLNSHILKFGLVKQNPILAISIRSIFAFPPLILIVVIWKGIAGITVYFGSEIFPLVLLSSLLIVFGDGMFLTGLRKYPVNVMLPISSIYPLITTIILILTGTESVRGVILVGTVVIIIGVALVTSGGSSFVFSRDALIFGISAAIGWGSSVFFIRKILEFEDTNPLGLLGIRNCLLGLEGLFVYLVVRNYTNKEIPMTKTEKRTSIKFLGLSGLLGDTIGASAFFLAVQRIGAAIPTPISSTNPIIAVIIGFLTGIELIEQKQLIGIMCCVLGTLIIVI